MWQRDEVFVKQSISDIIRRRGVIASVSRIVRRSVIGLVKGLWKVDMARMVDKELLKEWVLEGRVMLKMIYRSKRQRRHAKEQELRAKQV